jgi:DNA-binding transcriptional MerR regulator/methylmalonyl-CoA mutase cobalamin-binding subunit
VIRVPSKNPAPARYPIRAVARLTGLSVDTLRGWERRHHVVTPLRDERGRLYSGGDVKRLQLLAAAVERGHAIGRLAALSDAELEVVIAAPMALRVLDDVHGEDAAATASSPTLLAALQAFDAAAVERELNRLSLALKPRDLVHRVLFRFLKEVGDEWHANRLNIAQEHLLSGAVRSLLGAMVRLYSKENVSRRLLFATPSGERHEFGILAAAMLAAAGGLGVVYVGADVPARLIVDSAARSGVDVVVLGVLYSGSSREFRKQVDYIIDHLPGRLELWVGGPLPLDIGRTIGGRQIVRLPDFDAFERQLARIGARF